MVEFGVFLPGLNNGWIVPTAAPQYQPSYAMNRAMTLLAEERSCTCILRVILVAGKQVNLSRLNHWLPGNWLQVLGPAELAQIDQRVCQHLRAIMPLLDTFKSQQQSFELIFPGKGPLDTHA
jgi:hypothetical protein